MPPFHSQSQLCSIAPLPALRPASNRTQPNCSSSSLVVAMASSSGLNVLEYIIEGSHIREYARATANSQNEPLLLHIKQYVPKRSKEDPPRKGDLTVIGAHANGFPKELYEPLFNDFYQEAEKLGVRIRSFWIADCAWQGRSGVFNENKLGNDPGWLDYSRDILHIINTFRMPRPIFAIGHSFGANALTNVALIHPRLFSGMVLLDPVIAGLGSAVAPKSPAGLSVNRRDLWPSRDAAAESFARNHFYQSWDPRVLDLWVQFGLADCDSGSDSSSGSGSGSGSGPGPQVRLTTSKHQEVFTFLRPSWPAYDPSGKTIIHPDLVPDIDPEAAAYGTVHPVYRPEGPSTLSRLPNVRPAVLYVFGAKSDVSPPQLCEEKLRLTGVGVGGSGGAPVGRVSAVTHPRCGHLVPMEDPQFCAREAARWAKVEVDRWLAEEDEFEEWARKPAVEKVTVGEEFRRQLALHSRRGGNDEAGKATKAKM